MPLKRSMSFWVFELVKIYASSTFTAQTLYSGIFPVGSRAGLVSRLTDASELDNGRKGHH